MWSRAFVQTCEQIPVGEGGEKWALGLTAAKFSSQRGHYRHPYTPSILRKRAFGRQFNHRLKVLLIPNAKVGERFKHVHPPDHDFCYSRSD